MQKFIWTSAIIHTLKELLAEGFTSGEIAARLEDETGMHPTRHAIIGKVYRERLAFKHSFKTKPTGRPRKKDRPAPPQPKPIPRPTFRPEPPSMMPRFDGLGIASDDHKDFHCRCILDNGNRCDAIRVVGSSWCKEHRTRFIIPPREEQKYG